MARIKPVKPIKKLALSGFNNLTKSLSFNFYDVCYAKTAAERRTYLEYIDEEYNADRLTEILTECTRIIGANILNLARQDYDPQGASVTILVSEEPVHQPGSHGDQQAQQANGARLVGDNTAELVVGHLDKSHIAVHTYPEHHPADGIATFRADIEVSTCGQISPLHALNYLIEEFDSDVMNIDYRVRGFTRDITGNKFYIDHKIHSIQDYIDKKILRRYHCVDVNMYSESLFHTKMMWKKVDLDRYLFGGAEAKKRMAAPERKAVKKRLDREIQEIFYGCNLP